MARRATSLGPKTSLFLFCFFFYFFSFCFVFCFGGFKDQVRWPKGPPHLALNPPNLFIFCFFWFVAVPFLSLLCNTKKPCFPPRKGHYLFIFECLPLFLLSFFWPPSFSIFLSLSLSSSCLFFLSFLSFFFALFCFLVFVSFFRFLSSLLLFHEKNNIKILNYKVFLHQYFLFFGFLSSFLFEIPFLIFVFLLILSYVLFDIIVFGFKKTKLKNTNFWSKGGLQQNGFFSEPVFCKMWKVIVFFGAIFWSNFGWCANNTIKIGSCHFGFSPVPAETPIIEVFGDFEWAPKKDHFPKTDSCNENAHIFLTFRTQIVFAYFSKEWHCYKKRPFLFTTTPKHYLSGLFLKF